jgi:tetratricopeptide (TPR) repeat protein
MPSPGPDYHAIALADLALVEGRFADAVPLLQQGAERDLASKRTTSAANKLVTLAGIHAADGRSALAIASASKAASLSRLEGIQYRAALVFLDTGRHAAAAAIAHDLARRVENDPRAYAGALNAEALLRKGQAPQAAVALLAAAAISDAWLIRFTLGRAYLQAGMFTEAHSEFERCLHRKGEATALFLDDIPTWRYLPPVHFYLGRVQLALKSSAAPHSLHTFLGFRTNSSDPLAAEARKLIASTPP